MESSDSKIPQKAKRKAPSTAFKPGYCPPTAWKPGQSGNPGGRPKGLGEIRALAIEACPEAIATLIHLMREGETHQVRVACAKELMDRGIGKAMQPLEVGAAGQLEKEIAELVKLSDEELVTLARTELAKPMELPECSVSDS